MSVEKKCGHNDITCIAIKCTATKYSAIKCNTASAPSCEKVEGHAHSTCVYVSVFVCVCACCECMHARMHAHTYIHARRTACVRVSASVCQCVTVFMCVCCCVCMHAHAHIHEGRTMRGANGHPLSSASQRPRASSAWQPVPRAWLPASHPLHVPLLRAQPEQLRRRVASLARSAPPTPLSPQLLPPHLPLSPALSFGHLLLRYHLLVS